MNLDYVGANVDFYEPAPNAARQPVRTQERAASAPNLVHVTLPASGREIDVDNETLSSAVDVANRTLALAGSNTMLRRSIHEATNEFVVQVVDAETDEVIREVPPSSSLDRFARILELAGLLVDQRQ